MRISDSMRPKTGATSRTRGVNSASSGFAILETAVWTVVLLPLLLASAFLYALVHDQNVVKLVPDALLRETLGRAISWRADGQAGELTADVARLRLSMVGLVDRALNEVSNATFKLEESSAAACYSVLSIDPASGALSQDGWECETRGPLGNDLRFSVLNSLAVKVEGGAAGIGVPKLVTNSGEFSNRTVLVGVAVGGSIRDVSAGLERRRVQHAAVRRLREEIAL